MSFVITAVFLLAVYVTMPWLFTLAFFLFVGYFFLKGVYLLLVDPFRLFSLLFEPAELEAERGYKENRENAERVKRSNK